MYPIMYGLIHENLSQIYPIKDLPIRLVWFQNVPCSLKCRTVTWCRQEDIILSMIRVFLQTSVEQPCSVIPKIFLYLITMGHHDIASVLMCVVYVVDCVVR